MRAPAPETVECAVDVYRTALSGEQNHLWVGRQLLCVAESRHTAWDAYRKSGNIAWMALSHFSPKLRREDLKRLDLEIRRENGWSVEPPKARKVTGKARGRSVKRPARIGARAAGGRRRTS